MSTSSKATYKPRFLDLAMLVVGVLTRNRDRVRTASSALMYTPEATRLMNALGRRPPAHEREVMVRDLAAIVGADDLAVTYYREPLPRETGIDSSLDCEPAAACADHGRCWTHSTWDGPRPPAPDRLALWAHLVANHGNLLPLDASLEKLADAHRHEHRGPGGIRNHPEADVDGDLRGLAQVLVSWLDEQ